MTEKRSALQSFKMSSFGVHAFCFGSGTGLPTRESGTRLRKPAPLWERLRAGFIRAIRGPNQNRYTQKYISSRFAMKITTATGACALMTAYRSFNSSSSAGTILKLAAIGVTRVPQ